MVVFIVYLPLIITTLILFFLSDLFTENRKSFGDVALSDKKNKNSKEEEAVFFEETLLLEFGEGDAFLEQMLLKIEAVKVEALNLKNRVDKVVNENPCRFSLEKQKQPLLVTKNEDDSEEKTVKSASVSEDEDETTDILLSEMMQREGKAIVPNKKQQKTEQTSVEEGPSRPVSFCNFTNKHCVIAFVFICLFLQLKCR